MESPGFWDDPARSAPILKKRRGYERSLETLDRLQEDSEELLVYSELLAEGEPVDQVSDFLSEVQARLEKLDFQFKLSGPDDENDALLAINSGAGGTESQDWAEMLLRMYLRWAEKNGYKAELLERLDGEEAGIKSATLAIRGQYAYGYLRNENGVHRLVRISPFDSQSRRHTSFASVYVSPELDDDVEIDISPSDLRIDTYRASGAGGQHVNKTESAVRITHLPTNIVVSCQNERSQIKNRATAMKILKSRLYDREMQLRAAEQAKSEDEKMRINFGSQIRSYVLHPYRMVKDHRTKTEVGDADGVLDGNLDDFIEALLNRVGAEG